MASLWHRFLTDFWPPDHSAVAPNILASALCFWAGWAWKGKRAIRGLHSKLDRHHSEQMDAHAGTQQRLQKD